jgi:hypothetical protein
MNNFGQVDPGFLSLVQMLVNQVMHNCLWLVPSFMLLGFIVALLQAVFTSGEMMLDTNFLLRGVIIWFFLFNYLEILDIVTSAIEGLKNIFPVPDVLERLNNFASSVVSLKPTEPDPNASPADRLLDYIKGAFNFHFGLQYWLVSLIESGITLFIRISYEKLRALLLAFLTTVGPLSLTLSVIPGMERIASHWFRGWFVVHMWSVTLRILDSIIVNYNETVFNTAMANGETAFMDSIIINLVCILMYLMVPSLTTYFVGYAATSGFLGKLAGIVASIGAAAVFGAKASSGGRSAGSSATSGTNPNSTNGGPYPPSSGGSPTSSMSNRPLGFPSGGSAQSIPIRQPPVTPQPKPVPVYSPASTSSNSNNY